MINSNNFIFTKLIPAQSSFFGIFLSFYQEFCVYIRRAGRQWCAFQACLLFGPCVWVFSVLKPSNLWPWGDMYAHFSSWQRNKIQLRHTVPENGRIPESHSIDVVMVTGDSNILKKTFHNVHCPKERKRKKKQEKIIEKPLEISLFRGSGYHRLYPFNFTMKIKCNIPLMFFLKREMQPWFLHCSLPHPNFNQAIWNLALFSISIDLLFSFHPVLLEQLLFFSSHNSCCTTAIFTLLPNALICELYLYPIRISFRDKISVIG